ncbi:MAG: hypothetical protein KBT36_07340 [Kurthia sp.]|nr:hypothetical protein [Candidatus Kurthia equi]
MGLKYLEQTKSVVLTVLVLLSITLTFSIWSYRPHYETVEKADSVTVSMESKRQLSDVVQPYRLLLHKDGMWTGTADTEEMETTFKQLKKWELSDISPVSNNFSVAKLNDLMLLDNRMIFQFDSEVPMITFQNILPMSAKKVPEVSFDHLIISWSSLNKDDVPTNELTVFFSNSKQKQLYRAKIMVKSEKNFENNLLANMKSFKQYVPFQRENTNTLFLPVETQKMAQYKYLISSISIEDFKTALFVNPKIVKMSPDNQTGIEKYSDDKSIMTVDRNLYMESFVDSTATENQENIQKTHLISNTFNFINEHAGWTGDYRYSNVDYNAQSVDYQLYIENLPVYETDLGTTKIEVYWGNGRIYRYIRPTYKLAYLPQEKNKQVELVSGEQIVHKLMVDKKVDFNKITALRIGLTMKKDATRSSIYLFEPTWFYRIDDVWHAVKQKDAVVGGDVSGLE